MQPHVPTCADASREDGVVELRQYTLHPGQRDVLVELFDRAFVEPQEALGMRVLGQFRDLDDPDRFVWLRGFADMAARSRGLAAFYGGPVWAAHRGAANATMVDSDDVLLLRPAWPGAGVRSDPRDRVPSTAGRLPPGILRIVVFPLTAAAGDAVIDLARGPVSDRWRAQRADVRGWYVTKPSANNFPRLPVREGEHVLVGLAMRVDAIDHERLEIAPELSDLLAGAPRLLRLAPTARSALHGAAAA